MCACKRRSVVLTHVRIVDGTGRVAVDDQNVVLEGGKISAIQAGLDVATMKDTTVLDLKGYTVMPGIVGMAGYMCRMTDIFSLWAIETRF